MTTTTRSHQTTLDALDRAREFLLDYPEVPTPYVYIDDSGIAMRWHLDRQPHAVALDVLRLWTGWSCTPLDPCTAYRTVTADGIELLVFAATSTTPAEPVNLLDALAEVTG